jgi:hypothetical protein
VTEEWRPIPGYDGYDVSDQGNVRSWRLRGWDSYWGRRATNPKLLSPQLCRGYLAVLLVCGDKKKNAKVHALVLSAFVGPKPPGSHGCHENGDRTDNRVSNLRWDTATANAADRERHGRTARGERSGAATHPEKILKGEASGQAKLTEAHVKLLRFLCTVHDTSLTAFASWVGITKTAASFANRGKTWGHVPMQEKRCES